MPFGLRAREADSNSIVYLSRTHTTKLFDIFPIYQSVGRLVGRMEFIYVQILRFFFFDSHAFFNWNKKSHEVNRNTNKKNNNNKSNVNSSSSSSNFKTNRRHSTKNQLTNYNKLSSFVCVSNNIYIPNCCLSIYIFILMNL